jgi:V8-like Glu-specific endopeptidase
MISVRNTRFSQWIALLLLLGPVLGKSTVSEAVGVIVANKYLRVIENTDNFLLLGQSVQSRFQGCYQENVNQFSSGSCTGVLIAPNYFLTAGHCVDDLESFCKNNSIIFDYENPNFKFHAFENDTKKYYGEKLLKENKNLFKCKSVLVKRFERNEEDIAIIELQSKATRKYLKLATSSQTRSFKAFTSNLGKPIERSIEINPNVESDFKTTNSFSIPIKTDRGASGGPLVNEKGELVGIIISSIQEYSFDEQSMSCEHTDISEVPLLTIIMNHKAIERVLATVFQTTP